MINDIEKLLKLFKLVYSKSDQEVKDLIKLELKRIYNKLDVSKFLE